MYVFCRSARKMDDFQHLTSSAAVSKLSAKQLNALLKRYGKPISGTRHHRITIVCELLGLQSDPGSLQDVLIDIKHSKSGWIKDIRRCPPVTLSSVTDYLLRSHDTVTHTDTGHIERFTSANMKRYKTLRSYELYRAGHVWGLAPQATTCPYATTPAPPPPPPPTPPPPPPPTPPTPPPPPPLINRVRTLTQEESVSICGSDQLAIQLVFGRL